MLFVFAHCHCILFISLFQLRCLLCGVDFMNLAEMCSKSDLLFCVNLGVELWIEFMFQRAAFPHVLIFVLFSFGASNYYAIVVGIVHLCLLSCLFLSLARSLFSSLNSNECDDSVNAEKRLFFSFIWNLYRFKYHENTQIFLLLVSLDDGNNGNERRVRNKKMYIFTAVSSYLFTLRLWNSSLCLAFHFSYSVCVLWCVYMYRCI